MNENRIYVIIEGVSSIADDLKTTDEEALHMVLREKTAGGAHAHATMDDDATGADKQVEVSTWTKAISWIGILALAYQFILYPLLVWGWASLQAYQLIPCHIDPNVVVNTIEAAQAGCSFKPPTPLPANALFAVVAALLGIEGMKNYDRLRSSQ